MWYSYGDSSIPLILSTFIHWNSSKRDDFPFYPIYSFH